MPAFGGHPSVVYGTTVTWSVKATRGAPATSGAFASAVTSDVPLRVPAHRSEAWAVPPVSSCHPDARTKTGAELCTAVHRLSSVRGRRMRDTTVPGRTHNPCVTASPGLTVTSARPAAQLAAEGENVVADADGLGSLGLAGLIEEGTVDRGAEGGVGVLADGPAGRLPDGTPADRPPAEELQAARTNTPATIHALAHHRMPEPPGPLVRIPACPVGADRIARRASWANRCALACAEAHHRGLHPQRSAAGRQRPGPYGPARCGHGGAAVSGGGEAATGDGDGDGEGARRWI